MIWRTIIRQPVPAGASRRIRAAVRDEDGTLLGAAELASCVVTLTDQVSGGVVNGRDHQDILGANGGAVSAEGQLTLWLGAADIGMVDPAATREVRTATIEWSYGAGKVGKHEVVFSIVRTA